LLVVALALSGLTVLPTVASAGPVDDLVSSVALSLGTTTTGLAHERLIGVTWQSGTASVRYRWHTDAGWSSWATAEPDPAHEGIPGTEPLWRPAEADLAQCSEHLDALGIPHTPVISAARGRLIGFHDPDGHELSFYAQTQHEGVRPDAVRTVRSAEAGNDTSALPH